MKRTNTECARCAACAQYVSKRYTGWVKKEAAKKASQDIPGNEPSAPRGQDTDDQRKVDLKDHYARVLKFAQEARAVHIGLRLSCGCDRHALTCLRMYFTRCTCVDSGASHLLMFREVLT